MPYYISKYRGGGTHRDPFTPVGSEQRGWSAVDLRPDASKLDGGGLSACVLYLPEHMDLPGLIKIADDKREPLTPKQKAWILDTFRVEVNGTFADAIGTLLMRPHTDGVRPLTPVRSEARYEVWLGGTEPLYTTTAVVEAPGELIDPTDTFTRANETPLTTPWVNAVGGTVLYNLVSNEIRRVGSAMDTQIYYQNAVASQDHYSEVTFGTVGSNSDCGPVVRSGGELTPTAGQLSGVGLGMYNADEAFAKWLDGTYSNAGSVTTSNVIAGDVCRIEAEGSTYRGYKNGALITGGTITDTTVPFRGNGAGLFIYEPYTSDAVSVTTWAAGDLAVGLTPVLPHGSVCARDNYTEAGGFIYGAMLGYVSAGMLVVGIIQNQGTGDTLTSLTDTVGGNTWNTSAKVTNGAFESWSFWSILTNPLPQGAEIRATFSDTGYESHSILAVCYEGPFALDQDGTAFDSSFPEVATGPSTSETTAFADELLVNLVAINHDYPITPSTNFTERGEFQVPTTGPGPGTLFIEDRRVTSTGSYQASPTFAASYYNSHFYTFRTIDPTYTFPYEDDFNRVDINVLTAPWITEEGAFSLSSSTRAQPTNYANNSAAYYDVAWPNDQYAEVRVVVGGTNSNSGVGIELRSDGTGLNGYRIFANDGATNNIFVRKIVAGAYTTLATLSGGFTSSTGLLKAEIIGDTIRVYRDGVQVGSDIVDATFTSGKAGIVYLTSSSASYIDSWEGGRAAVSWVNEQTAGATGDAPLAFPNPVRAGSLLIAMLEDESGSLHGTPTDTLGNTWTEINSLYLNQRVTWWYAIANGPGFTTVTFPATVAGFEAVKVSEWSVSEGDIVLDVEDVVHRSTTTSGTDCFLSPSVTASADDSLVLGYIATVNGDATTITAGTNYAMRNKTALDSSGNDTLALESRILTTAGSVQAAFTAAGTNTLANVGVAVFKVAGEEPLAEPDQKSNEFIKIIKSEPSLTNLFEFNEASGNFVDSKGSVTTTAPGGGVLLYQQEPLVYDAVEGDYAIQFVRSLPTAINFGDNFDIANNTSFTLEFTFENLEFEDGWQSVLMGKGFQGAGGGWWIDFWNHTNSAQRDGNCLRFRRWNVAGTAGPELYCANAWRPGEKHHVIITLNSSIDTIEGWVDGVKLSQAVGAMTTSANAENMYIGAYWNSTSGGAGQGTTSLMDTFAWYNNYMPEDRIIEHYRAFLNPRKRTPMLHVQRDYIVDDYMREQGAAGDRRAAEGSYGMWYERGNYIEAPGGAQSNAQDNTNGWTASGSTLTRDTTEHAFGTTSFKVDTNGGGTGEGMLTSPRITFPASQQGVFSCWVKAPVSAAMELAFEEFTSGGALVDVETLSFVGTGDWQHVEQKNVFGATGDSARLWIRTETTQNINFYVGGIQLEATGTTTGGGDRAWSSPYMGHYHSAGGGRGAQRLMLEDSDLPVNFYIQGWTAYRYRHGFNADAIEQENQGFFQRGNNLERISIYSTGYQRFLSYIGSAGGVGDNYADFTISPAVFTKGTKYTGLGGWQLPTQAYAAVDGANLATASPVAVPNVKAAIGGVSFADTYGSYQWFGMRPESEVFWSIMGSGVCTNADSAALAALPDHPTVAQVRSALSRASAPFLLYNSGDLFAEVIQPQTQYVSRRRMVQR